MTTESMVYCPKCRGYWYLDLDEGGLPYTCFVCCNTGFVTVQVADSYIDEPVYLDDRERYGEKLPPPEPIDPYWQH